MIGIIVSGHGNFATGIGSALELIVGVQNNLELVDFNKNDSVIDLETKIVESMKKMDVDGYLFLTDIPGGSPFKKCVEIGLKYKNCKTIAGTNVPMLLDVVFDRDEENVSDLIERVLISGKNHIVTFNIENKKKCTTQKDDDMGI